MNPKSSTSREFVERLDLIDAQSPQDASDVRETLEEFGLAADQLVKDALALVEAFETNQRQARLADAARKRKAELLQIASRPRSRLEEAALIERLEQLRARPGGQQLHFKDLKSCTRDELEALLDEFSYLADEDGSKEE